MVQDNVKYPVKRGVGFHARMTLFVKAPSNVCPTMRKILIPCIMLLILTETQAQRSNKLDSLLTRLEHAQDDTLKVMTLLHVADYYEANNQDSSIYYLEKARDLSDSLNFPMGMYHYHEQSAIVYFTKGDYTRAMDQSNNGLLLARQLNDSALVVNMLNNIAIVYGYLGEFKTQLNYMLKAKVVLEALNDSSKLSGLYQGLSNCYYNLTDYRKSVQLGLLSIALHVKYKKRNSYINRVFATLAQNYDALQLNDSALYFYDHSISESVRLNDMYAAGMIYGYKCNLLARMAQFEPMLVSAQKSLAIAKELQSPQMLANSLYNLAYANFLNDDNKAAKKNIDEALAISSKNELSDELKNSYMVLSYVAARGGEYKTVVWARQRTDSIQNAFVNETILKSTTELEKKYESEKKDTQLKLQSAQLQKKDIVNYILIAGALIIVVTSLLAYRNFKQKQTLQQHRINELETEKLLTATEGVLKGEEQERTRLAKDLHDGLGGMLSGIKYSFNTMKGNLIMTPDNQQAFERSMDMLDSSIKEMRRVAHNMMPEALVKFGLDSALRDFCNDINQSGGLKVNYLSIGLEHEIEQTTAITLYRIVQELINNTMKHASAKMAIVQVTKTGESIAVTVEDDGRGFDTTVLSQSKGIGWSNIQHRVDFLKGKLDVDSRPGKGTSVHIEINA
jgi:signal transduction histidine kinase